MKISRLLTLVLLLFLGIFPAFSAEKTPYAKQLPTTAFDAPEGTWSLVVMPDTQYYAQDYPDVFMRQTEWIAKHKDSHNIRFVLHEGDITNRNKDNEWERARKAMDVLEKAEVPYAIVLGNHDYHDKDINDRSVTKLTKYFPVEGAVRNGAIAFFEKDKIDNAAYRYEINGYKFLVLALEYYPRSSVIIWANKVAEGFPDHSVILLTHAYLRASGNYWTVDLDKEKYPKRTANRPNDGLAMWKYLVSRNGNFRFTFSGHVFGSGVAYVSEKNKKGQKVHQILSNFQRQTDIDDGTGWVRRKDGSIRRPYGGGGFLRILQFLPDGKTVRIKTYSPWYDRWLTGKEQAFEFKVDLVKAPPVQSK